MGRFILTEQETVEAIRWRLWGRPDIEFTGFTDGFKGADTVIRLRCRNSQHAACQFHLTPFQMFKKHRLCPICTPDK